MSSRWWTLPAAAAAFALGVLSGGDGMKGPPGAAAVASGLALVAVSAWPRREAAEPHPLLAAGGLERGPPPLAPREGVLAGAGLPARRRAGEPWGALRVGALLLGVALAGVGWSDVRGAPNEALGPLRGRAVTFHGVAVGDPRSTDFGWNLEVGVHRLRPPGEGERKASLKVWVTGSARPPPVSAGMPIAASGVFDPVPPEPGFGDYLRARGVDAIVDVSELDVLGPPRNPLLRLANAVREGLRRGALSVLPRREAGLLLGLAIGDTELMDPEVEEDFRATGLGHLLAVSGSNVALFLAPVLGLLVALRLRRTTRLLAAIVAVAFFVLVTRWEPSVLRAGVMACLALVGLWAGRRRHTASVLGGAVLVLLVADPGLASSVGFQLSAAATGGLASLASPLAERLRWLPRPLALAAAATLAAQVAVTPLLLLHFGVVPTATLVANVLVFPAVAVSLLAGIVAAGAALLWLPLGRALGEVAGLPLGYLVGVADRTAHLALPAVASNGWAVPALAAALIPLVAWRVRRGRAPAGVAAVAVTLGLVAWSAAPAAGPPASLEVVFLDVGQGDAALVRTPDGATVVVDAGPDPDQVATQLAALGVRRLDVAVASHAHADHIEGFPAVLSRHPVGLFLEPGCPGDSPSYARLLRALADEDVPVRHPRGGITYQVGGLLIEVLGPDACAPDSPNDDSLVLRISYRDDVVLFPGDAEVPAQEDLLGDGDTVTADVLKVPHHGGDTSLEEFLAATEARVAVVSTGPNEYGHPVPSVLSVLESLGMEVVRTDLQGTVTVRFREGGVLLESEPP